METTTALHKKETSVKALLLQSEEDRKNILILQESLEKLNEKIKMYKKQLEEQEQISNSNIMRVIKNQPVTDRIMPPFIIFGSFIPQLG